MDDATTMLGMRLDDSFEVERVLSSGATGSTELVRAGGEGPFVRKRVPEGLASREAWLRLAERPTCPRLPQVCCAYELPDELVVVCAYVAGRTLREEVREAGPTSPARTAALVADVCEAAGWLHARGVVHRDLTPDNVVVAEDGAHVIDLGISRVPTPGAARDTTLLGTRGYAAPEQYGFAQTDARSDVFSIGRLALFLLTGEDPSPSAEGLPRELAGTPVGDVLERACAFEPGARYQRADALSRALLAAADEQGADGEKDDGDAGAGAAAPGPGAEDGGGGEGAGGVEAAGVEAAFELGPAPVAVAAFEPAGTRRRPVLLAVEVVMAALAALGTLESLFVPVDAASWAMAAATRVMLLLTGAVLVRDVLLGLAREHSGRGVGWPAFWRSLGRGVALLAVAYLAAGVFVTVVGA